MTLYLEHHGIRGQKWGVKNGPPYPLSGGDYSPEEKKHIYKKRLGNNNDYNKKHFDKVIDKGTVINTLSYDKDRTKGADMFFGAYRDSDKHQYNALFNKKVPTTLYDDSNRPIGTGECYKFRIKNKVKDNIKVASEDSAANAFLNLYKKDRDFYNFVTDKKRMQAHVLESRYKFKGYRESRDVLNKIRSGSDVTEKDVRTVYRMFNLVIPSDAGGNQKEANDVIRQRAKFFKELKKSGYGAVLDTNDGIYGGYKSQAPAIVFDMSAVVLDGIERTTASEVIESQLTFLGRKYLGG